MERLRKVYEKLSLEDKEEITFKYLSDKDPENYKSRKNEWHKEVVKSPILAEEYFYELYTSGKIDHYIEHFIAKKEKTNDYSPDKTNVIDDRLNPFKMLHPAAQKILIDNQNDPEKAISFLKNAALNSQIRAANSATPSEQFKYNVMAEEFWNAHDWIVTENQKSIFNRHYFTNENDLETRFFTFDDPDFNSILPKQIQMSDFETKRYYQDETPDLGDWDLQK